MDCTIYGLGPDDDVIERGDGKAVFNSTLAQQADGSFKGVLMIAAVNDGGFDIAENDVVHIQPGCGVSIAFYVDGATSRPCEYAVTRAPELDVGFEAP